MTQIEQQNRIANFFAALARLLSGTLSLRAVTADVALLDELFGPL